MKKNEKIMIVILLVIGILMLGVLVVTKIEIWNKPQNTTNQEPKKTQGMIDNSNEDYSLEKAIESGYFVIGHNKIYNKDKLDKFIENTSINSKNRIEDSIKIIQYTTEGDPIITELSYNINDSFSGKQENKGGYILKVDNTRDKWSVEEDRKITVKDDIPGNIYGIVERKNGNIVDVELALYAEIDYIDENAKKYETIHVCSYRSDVT